ncbi:MAG: molybdopterin-dependent oxidoreductase [Actinobacteria bacterium]|nr:molybdopterin-dependent oxidoreductase [Actinomycetota bacterium]
MADADDDAVKQIQLRIGDLARSAARDAEPEIDDYEGLGGNIQVSDLPQHARDRVPPGQRITRGWPVLHVGGVPRFDESSWQLEVAGEVAAHVSLTYAELKALPGMEMRSDFHCVTGWSKFDNYWTGVKVTTILDLATPRKSATHVSVGDGDEYTANLPLEVLLDDDVMVAWAHNGKDLAPKHGFPLRLVVPKYYGWKSVKWVRSFELIAADRRGFWELRGYHNRADPWLEERYSYQESR